MFRPLSIYMGLRYIRAKRRNRFISFISLVSILGIALGVMVLITVLSVMNGFDQKISQKLFTFVPNVTITGNDGTLSNWQHLVPILKKNPHIKGMMPYISGQGLLVKDNVVAPMMVQGINAAKFKTVSALPKHMLIGSFSYLKSNHFGIVLGESLAGRLNVVVGDKVNLLTPKTTVTPIGILPRYKRFTVVGIFHVSGGFGLNRGYAFIDIQDAAHLFMMHDRVSALQLKSDALFTAPFLSLTLQRELGMQYQVSDWTNIYGGFYHAVRMEKTMMFFILLLLVAIAAFNLVSSLVMLVNDKRSDIAILRTFGATPGLILRIFIVQGLLVGAIGTFLGAVLGILLSLNATKIVTFVQNLFHVQLFTPGVYWVDYLPSQLQWSDVWHIVSIALLMSFVATLYPAWRAAQTQPAEALRYE